MQPWQMNLGPTVELIDPQGRAVPDLPIRSRGLLGMLATIAPEPVTRARAAELLWPHSSAAHQATSLRQTLATLRKATGEAPFLRVGRTSLTLDLTLLRISLRHSPDLLSLHTEPWFILLRSSLTAARQTAILADGRGREDAAVRSLEDLLEWTVTHQPNNAFGLIRYANDLATNMAPHRALELSDRALKAGSPTHPLRGWAAFLRAWALFYCNETAAASDALHEVRLAATHQQQGELLALCSFFEAGCLMYLGELDQAEALWRPAAKLDPAVLRARGQVRMIHSLGLIEGCRGHYESGFAQLLHAAELARVHGEQFEEAYVAVNLAWMAASVGYHDTARQALERFVTVDTGASWRFRLTSDLAAGHGTHVGAQRFGHV
jgi:tetratricopeptide (TPR) repeat protein